VIARFFEATESVRRATAQEGEARLLRLGGPGRQVGEQTVDLPPAAAGEQCRRDGETRQLGERRAAGQPAGDLAGGAIVVALGEQHGRGRFVLVSDRGGPHLASQRARQRPAQQFAGERQRQPVGGLADGRGRSALLRRRCAPVEQRGERRPGVAAERNGDGGGLDAQRRGQLPRTGDGDREAVERLTRGAGRRLCSRGEQGGHGLRRFDRHDRPRRQRGGDRTATGPSSGGQRQAPAEHVRWTGTARSRAGAAVDDDAKPRSAKPVRAAASARPGSRRGVCASSGRGVGGETT
jgi:hypothetical protein